MKNAAKFSDLLKSEEVLKEISADVNMNFIFAENLYKLGQYKAAFKKVNDFFDMHFKTSKLSDLVKIDFYLLKAKILFKMASTQSTDDDITLIFECRTAIDQAKESCEA